MNLSWGWRGVAAASGIVVVAVGTVAATFLRPGPPRYPQGIGPVACTAAAGHSEFLVVDWKPEERGDLEIAMKNGGWQSSPRLPAP
jgi:hypothetical protein